MMPRLPRKVPLSEKKVDDLGETTFGAALVFACTSCWSTSHWAMTAYNDDGDVWQTRRCRYWACLSRDGKGKWITQDEAFERTRYQWEMD